MTREGVPPTYGIVFAWYVACAGTKTSYGTSRTASERGAYLYLQATPDVHAGRTQRNVIQHHRFSDQPRTCKIGLVLLRHASVQCRSPPSSLTSLLARPDPRFRREVAVSFLLLLRPPFLLSGVLFAPLPPPNKHLNLVKRETPFSPFFVINLPASHDATALAMTPVFALVFGVFRDEICSCRKF